jgi:hypothetical protein
MKKVDMGWSFLYLVQSSGALRKCVLTFNYLNLLKIISQEGMGHEA